MPTQSQLDLAKKYGYTQEQINQEMANPGSVKRVAAVGTPTYEQPVNGQFATTTPQPVVQPRPGVTQQGNTLNVTQDIYSQLSPNTLAQAQNKGFNVQTSQAVPQAPTTPVPGSVSSILGEGFGAEDPFVSQYYKDQLSQYNQTIDPQAAYNEQLALRQAQIDATNALYRDQLNQARIQGQGRLGSGRAIQARGGLLGSSFGAAQTNQIQSANTDIENAIEQERLAVVNQIMTNARTSAAADIAEKRKAKEEGGKAFLAWMNGADDRKAAKTSKAAKLLLSLGKSPQDISDEELKQAGISRQDLTMEYTAGKSAQDAAATTAELDQAKKIAEIEKLNADIAKGQLDASKYYEVGNRIYEQGTNRYIGDSAFNPYTGAMQVTPGNSVYNPVTGKFTQAPTTIVNVPGTIVQAQIGDKTVSMNSTALAGIQNAMANMPGAIIGSTGRSYEEQKRLYEAYQNGTGGLAAPPGTSKHESGLGVDLYGGTGPDGKLLPPTPQMIQQMEANGFKWMNLPGDAGHFEYVGTSGGGTGQGQYSDSDIELLAELANMEPSARNTALKAQGIPLQRVTDYMAMAKSGKIPPTEAQKQSSIQIMSQIQDLANMEWNDATGAWRPELAGSDRATGLAKINSLIAAITLPNLGMLKGPMSDKDLAFIQNASTRLAPTQSDTEFEKQLVELYNIGARKNGMKEITKLSEIPTDRILPGQNQPTGQTGGEVVESDWWTVN